LRIELNKEGVFMTKILVTGGAGFIGSHVVDLFLSKGYEVVVLDDLSTGRLSNLNPRAAFYQIDIRSPKVRDVFAAERPDFVSHHAAQMDVRRSVAEPLFDADVNILGSINLIECAREFEVKHFIYISSGGAAYGEPERLPCDENHPVNPICPYGASKHTVEHYLYMYSANYGLKYTVLRYPNVFGPRQNPQGEAGVVAIFTGKMLADEPALVNGNGEQTRDFVYVGDCAHANYLAVSVDHPSGIYNLGWGRPTSVNDIFFALAKATSYSQPIQHGPAKLGETRHIYLDAKKIMNELGWTPAVTLEQGLEKTISYFQDSEIVP
jgi:UDP-glucose 4-epimerase